MARLGMRAKLASYSLTVKSEKVEDLPLTRRSEAKEASCPRPIRCRNGCAAAAGLSNAQEDDERLSHITIDWTLRAVKAAKQRPGFQSARAKIKVLVKRILRKHGYPPDLEEEATKTVLAQAELLCAEWAGV